MKQNKILRASMLLVMLVCAGIVVNYYWQHSALETIKEIPMYVMIVTLVYILIQISKRSIYKEQRWYDWLYYIGLIAMMLPTVMVSESNVEIFNYVTDVCTLFLIVPIILEGKVMVNGKK